MVMITDFLESFLFTKRKIAIGLHRATRNIMVQ